MATYIEPLAHDILVLTTPAVVNSRSGASATEMFKKLYSEYKKIKLKLEPSLETLVKDRQALSIWLQENWDNIPATLDFLFTIPHSDNLQGAAQVFLQQFPILEQSSKKLTATKLEKTAPVQAVTTFCDTIEQVLYNGVVSQKLGDPKTFLPRLIQNQVPIDAPYPLDYWKYRRVLFELAVANKLFDRVETYYDALETSIRDASILYDGLKAQHPQILVDGARHTTNQNPDLYVHVYGQHSKESQLINKQHKILSDFRAVPPNEEGWLSRVYTDSRAYLEHSYDEAGNFPTPTAALTYLKQAYIKKEEALAVKDLIRNISGTLEIKMEILTKCEKNILHLLQLDISDISINKPEWETAVKGYENTFILKNNKGVIKRENNMEEYINLYKHTPAFHELVRRLQARETLQAFKIWITPPGTEMPVHVALEEQMRWIKSDFQNLCENHQSLYNQEGIIPDLKCIQLEQKIQSLLKNLEELIPIAIDILQDNQEYL